VHCIMWHTPAHTDIQFQTSFDLNLEHKAAHSTAQRALACWPCRGPLRKNGQAEETGLRVFGCAPLHNLRHESRHPAPPSQTTAQLPRKRVSGFGCDHSAQSRSRPTCCPMDEPYELDATLLREEGCGPRCLPRNRASRRQQTRAEALFEMRARCSPCCCVNSRSFTASVTARLLMSTAAPTPPLLPMPTQEHGMPTQGQCSLML